MKSNRSVTTRESIPKDDDGESVSSDDYKSPIDNDYESKSDDGSKDFFDTQDAPEHFAKNEQLISAKNSSLTLENLKKFNELNERDKDGRTELMRLAEAGNYSKIKELIQNGADVTFLDKDGNTALMLACQGNHYDAARIIVEAMEPKLTQETTPEQYNNGLIRKYHFMNQKNRKGETALLIATKKWKGFALNNYIIEQSGSGNPKDFIASVKAKLGNEILIHKQLSDSAQRLGSKTSKEIEGANILALEAKLSAVDKISLKLKMVQETITNLAQLKEKLKARAADKTNSLFDRIGASNTSAPEFKGKLDEFESEYLGDVEKFTESKKQAKEEARTIHIPTDAANKKLVNDTKAGKKRDLKTQLASINSKEKSFKDDLKQQQKELGKEIRMDRLAKIFGGEVSGYTREQLRDMQKMIGRVIRSDQATGIVDKILPGRKKSVKGRT